MSFHSNVFRNYGNTVQSNNSCVFTPYSELELIQFVEYNSTRRQPYRLKPIGLGHCYSNGPIARHGEETQAQILIDMSHLQFIRLCCAPDAEEELAVEVSPSVEFPALLEYLEARDLRLPNIPHCLNLSVGGLFSMSGHGSGAQAAIGDLVHSLRLLKCNGTIQTVLKGDELMMSACAGGMGTVSIILSMVLSVENDTAIHETFRIVDSPQAFVAQEHKRHECGDAGSVTDLDYAIWIPLIDRIIYIRRRKTKHWIRPRRQVLLEAVAGVGGPLATKLVNTLVQHHWTAPETAFQTMFDALKLTLSLQTERNTLYRMQRQASDLLIKAHKPYECVYDCEVFIPLSHLSATLQLFNWIFRLIHQQQHTLDHEKCQVLREAKQHVPELFHPSRLESMLGQTKALTVIPALIRYCPATDVGYLAGNYQQDMYGISIAWFGKRQDKCHYERLIDWIIDLSVLHFHGRFHFGKYNHLLQMPPSMLQRYQQAYEPSWSLQRACILREDPQLIFQNDFTRQWFNLLSQSH